MNKLVFILAIICSISILIASCSDEETQTDAEKAEAAEAAA
ncbi:uncharacterized protein METZ01_LOCUS270759, partial [marine metagenome]